MTELQKLSDLSQVKKGDTIWTIQSGYGKVTSIIEGCYPIRTDEYSYCKNGLHSNDHEYPSAFLKNPFEHFEFKEREMWVSNDNKQWLKQKIIGRYKNYYLTFDLCGFASKIFTYEFAKEIEPEQPKDETFDALKGIIELFEKLTNALPVIANEEAYLKAKKIIEN
jgi:hypothetical protein